MVRASSASETLGNIRKIGARPVCHQTLVWLKWGQSRLSPFFPELPPGAWKDAVRGRFYRPVKQAVSMRLDADVIAWLKKQGKGYQTRANSILRERMLEELRRT